MKARSLPGAFTVLELIVTVAMLGLLAAWFAPAFARTEPHAKTIRCANNLRQLSTAWRQFAEDNSGSLVGSVAISSARQAWITGTLNFDGANASNYDTNYDFPKSPLWTYVGQSAELAKCPADPTVVTLLSTWNGLPAGTKVSRVRSISMSSVFGSGAWSSAGTVPTNVWRLYAKYSDIVIPAYTFVFIEENSSSLNDSEFSVDPTAATLTSCPGSYHNGAGNVSFADGHTETHPWIGSFIRLGRTTGVPNPNLGDSWVDAQWLARNATVKW